MDSQRRKIVDAALRLATQAPKDSVERLSFAIGTAGGTRVKFTPIEVAQLVSNPHSRVLAAEFVQTWRRDAADITPAEVAMALATAAESEHRRRQQQQIELVWTGPATQSIPVRDTEQIILELIACAKKRLTILSFGVYKIPRVADALRQAAACRDVCVRIILGDREDEYEQIRLRNLHAFGKQLTEKSVIYCWPPEKRHVGQSVSAGLMHVKCVVADSEALFLTSANLTESALALNMELGICIRGGSQPAQVDRHFDQLIAAGELKVFA